MPMYGLLDKFQPPGSTPVTVTAWGISIPLGAVDPNFACMSHRDTVETHGTAGEVSLNS